MSITIYHNPRCSKSRQAKALLEERGIEPEVVEYLKGSLSFADVKGVLGMLGVSPRDVMRKGEEPYKSLNLKDQGKTDNELIQAIVDHPILLERPIVVSGGRAVIGRPPENILDLI
ncbi:MAG: arsenate reductase (glutaredoxin) [Fimbriimonadaceae bacterium]|nr:arsenate reductase (glutaredoxin) [Alphaproteobacteria bacterium]